MRLALALLLFSPVACASGHRAEADAWHAERMRTLRAEDGWLTLVGICWLEEGVSTAGRAAHHAVSYAGFPAEDLGAYTRAGGAVTFAPAPGAPLSGLPEDGRVRSDAEPDPTVLKAGSCTLLLIERGGRFAVRVKDALSPLRAGMADVARFPVDPAWRLEARFEPAAGALTVPIESVIGRVTEEPVGGRAVFERGGRTCRMVLLATGDSTKLFVVFGDETNGRDTYGGGRFLTVERAAGSGTVILDFNRAYNPPCAFTPYSTCPLPPEENRLPFAVTAGERAP